MAKKKSMIKVGDEVYSFLLKLSGERVKVRGVVKQSYKKFGLNEYVVGEASIEDFATRTVKLAK